MGQGENIICFSIKGMSIPPGYWADWAYYRHQKEFLLMMGC
jgi:hypothetical protein